VFRNFCSRAKLKHPFCTTFYSNTGFLAATNLVGMKKATSFRNARRPNTSCCSGWVSSLDSLRRCILQITTTFVVLFLLVIDNKNAGVHCGGGFFSEPNTPVLQAAETIIFGIEQHLQQEVSSVSSNNGEQSGSNSSNSNINSNNSNSNVGINVTMQIRIRYEGPPSEFSWVLPLPSKPTTVSVGSELLFHRLEEATAPVFNLRILEESASCAKSILEKKRNLCDTSTPPDAQVEAGAAPETTTPMPDIQNDTSMGQAAAKVLQQGSLEPYDYVIIESSIEYPDAAYDWLESNVSQKECGVYPSLTSCACLSIETDVADVRVLIQVREREITEIYFRVKPICYRVLIEVQLPLYCTGL
jgi:Uncharacterized protein conserved in bacteria (DUF2330)